MRTPKFKILECVRACVAAGLVLGGTSGMAADTAVAGAKTADSEPLTLKLPGPTMKATPVDLVQRPNIEPFSKAPRPPFLVPKGSVNLAAGKPVTSSVSPFTGELKQITDGLKDPVDEDAVEFKKGAQWVQIDLGKSYPIYAIVVWHDHRFYQVMRDVIVQVADDPEFKTGVTTLFNNDSDNSSGLGAGTDREYFETNQGRLIDAKGTKARYVRCHTKGGSAGGLNFWQEVEVYGLSQ